MKQAKRQNTDRQADRLTERHAGPGDRQADGLRLTDKPDNKLTEHPADWSKQA